jgi:hypothetical protein
MKRMVLVVVLLALVGAPVVAPPPAGASADGARIARLFERTTRETTWTLVRKVPLHFNAYHPEGLARVGRRFVLSAVEVTEPTQRFPGGERGGTDRTPGAGRGHLIAFNGSGALVRDRRLDDGARIYHPGGLDFDGRDLWTAVAEYRPNRPSLIYRLNPRTLRPRSSFRVPDHIGGIVHATADRRVLGLNWGARTAYQWTLSGRLTRRIENPSFFVDYQDCKYLGRPRRHAAPLMLCCGITTYSGPGVPKLDLGGVALVDVRTMRPVREIPFSSYTDQQQVATRNALDVRVLNGRLRLYLVADDNDSDLLVYEASAAADG